MSSGVLVYVLIAVPNGPFSGTGIPSQYEGIRGCRLSYFRRGVRLKIEEVVPFLKWPTHYDIVTLLNDHYPKLRDQVASIPFCRDFGNHGAPDWWPPQGPGNLAPFATWGWYELLVPEKGTKILVEGPSGGPVVIQTMEKVLTWQESSIPDETPPPPSIPIMVTSSPRP